MKFKRENAFEDFSKHLVLSGAFFVVLYWIIESAVHSYFFDGGPFLEHVIYPDRHETWMRLIVAALLIIFSLYGQNVINQLRRIKLTLIEREKEAQRILENNPAAIVLIDCASREISYANQNALNLIGLPLSKVHGKQCHDFLCQSQKGKCPVLDLGQSLDISERELVTATGKVVPVLKNVTTVQYKDRPHLLETFFDVTKQKKMRQDLCQAHAELDQIFQTATVGMRLIDSKFNILKINHAFTKLSGIEPEDAIGGKCFDVFAGNMCHSAECPLQRVKDGKSLEEYEVSKIRSDGSILTCQLTVSRFEQPGGDVAIVEAFKDITELKKIQDALKSERDRLHRILFHQFESVGIINDQYILEYQNEVLKKHTDGKNPCYCFEVFRDTHQSCNNCHMLQAITSGKIQRFEFDTAAGKNYQHTYTPFLDNDGHRKAVVSRLDITEHKASVAAAMSSERLAALGELAAGVAHEINNPINSIINYAQILVNKTEINSQFNDISGRIVREGDRISAIVESLLSFARSENESRSWVCIKDLVNESLTLTGAQLKKDGVKISIRCDKKLLPVSAMAQEIEQVFLNIINNSRYALNEKYPQGGELKRLNIGISLVTNDSGLVVRTCFTDFGSGIPENLLEKIFNPFFSTKPEGKGTGLGLAISHRIIENHGGRLSVKSTSGLYTRVRVDLPTRYANNPEDQGYCQYPPDDYERIREIMSTQ